MVPALTVGVLTPHASPGPEIELPVLSAGGVATLVSRIPLPVASGLPGSASLENLRHGTHPSAVHGAAAAFPQGSVDALAYASTSSGYLLGAGGEERLLQRLRDDWRLPAVSSSLAAVEALRAQQVERVTVVHPPWFDDPAHALGAVYFSDQGFDVVAVRADSLPSDPALVRPGQVTDWVLRFLRAASGPVTEAIFLGGNGFRAAASIGELERLTGLLVLEANQVLLWALLSATSTSVDTAGHGRLFEGPVGGPD